MGRKESNQTNKNVIEKQLTDLMTNEYPIIRYGEKVRKRNNEIMPYFLDQW